MESENINRQIAEKVMGWVIPKDKDMAFGRQVYHKEQKRWVWAHYWCKQPPVDYEDELTGEMCIAPGCYFAGNEVWRPSTNIAHAFEVVEKMDDCLHLRQHGEKGNWSASFCGHYHGHANESHADTPAMAICLAALEAVTP